MESGSQKRELSHPTSPCHLQTQTGRDVPLQVNAALLPQLEEEGFSPPPPTAQPMRDCHNSANENHYTLNSQFSPMDLLLTISPHASLFLIKELSSALFPGLVYGSLWLASSELQFSAIPALIYFCWKNDWQFYF